AGYRTIRGNGAQCRRRVLTAARWPRLTGGWDIEGVVRRRNPADFHDVANPDCHKHGLVSRTGFRSGTCSLVFPIDPALEGCRGPLSGFILQCWMNRDLRMEPIQQTDAMRVETLRFVSFGSRPHSILHSLWLR